MILGLLLALGTLGCRSTAPVPLAEPPEAPSTAMEPRALASPPPPPTDLAPTDLESAEQAEEVPEPVAPSEERSVLSEPDEAVEAGGQDALGEPDALQRWALELCQSAESLLDEGDAEGALAALDQAYELMLQLPDDVEHLQAKEDIRLLVADLIQRHYDVGRSADAEVRTASWDLEMPAVHNEHVEREIRSFTGPEREAFLEGYRRSGLYRPMILAKLQEAGLPSQLSWLPMVESWFKTRAYSRASAVGMWQFISSTGQRYGLSRDRWVDERYDPVKSTDAAIGYLTDLHGMFGDWPKALAGYNCGEARVARLTRRSSTDYLDFWDLYELLPRETRRYVPRLYAALAIIEDPEKYEMKLPEPELPPEELTRVTVERPVKLAALDQRLELAEGTLSALNPELRHRSTPPHAYELLAPASREKLLVAHLGDLPAWSPPARSQGARHRVRRGQTLGAIARRYGTSVGALMRANNLRSAHRIREGQLLYIPGRGGAVARVERNAPNGVHTVRRGESLGAIAAAYGTTVQRIKAANGLSSNLIHPGQQLRVASGAGSSRSGGGRVHTVRRGDTPSTIARRHGVSLSALLRANDLGRRSTIYPGQKLVIP